MTTVVTITEPEITVTPTEEIVTVNITEQVTAVTIASGVRTLVNLSDVAITTPTDDQVLTYDDTTGKWINQSVIAIAATDVSNLTTTTGNAGEWVRVATGGGLEYRTSIQALSDIGAETTGAAATVQTNLNTHTGDLANPHVVTIAQIGAAASVHTHSYLANIVEDTTPQLGGNLDLNGNVITGLVIGTNVQAFHQNLADIAGLAPGAGEDGYSITWDDTAGAFVLTEVTGGGSSLPVVDTTAVVMGSADNTKLLRFEVDGFTTGTTRVLTPPDADGTIAVLGQAQTFTAAQTVTGGDLTVGSSVDNTRSLIVNTEGPSGAALFFSSSGKSNGIIQQGNQPNRFQGNTGIGIAGDAAEKLQVAGNIYLFNNGSHILFGATSTQATVRGDGSLKYIRIYTSGAERMQVDTNGDVRIGGADAHGGQLHVDQHSATGAQPVLYLDQADVSEEIIEIVSTAGVGNAVEAVGAKTLTVTEFIKITVNGNTRYLEVGTIA